MLELFMFLRREIEIMQRHVILALLQEICVLARQKWDVTRIAIGHRTGRVDIAQASVIICVSSPHRREAIEACHWIIDELKAFVPIWKKEFFADGSVWKENAESRRLHGSSQAP
jgi:molybdopterin synthase catalytic subunit